MMGQEYPFTDEQLKTMRESTVTMVSHMDTQSPHIQDSRPREIILSFQERVKPWLLECFGEEIASDKMERSYRFIEESLELVQSMGMSKEHVLKMVDYVFSRPEGEPFQEVGGVMVTLAALCLASDLNMHDNAETELTRIWTKVDKIRAKQVTKEVLGVANIKS